MSTRLGLISDVHSSPAALAEALDIFARKQVSDIICAGDIAGYFDNLLPTIELLEQAACKTIIGNHDQAYIHTHCDQDMARECLFLEALPDTLELTVENKRIYCVHAEPPSTQHGGIKLLDQQGEVIPQRLLLWHNKLMDLKADILIVGHTHQVFAEQLGDVLVINPGSSVFNHSCMILSLPECTVETFALENKDIIKCWNFSMLYGSGNPYPRKGM